MAATRNLKLGIFVLAALVATLVAAVVLGIHAMAPHTVAYHTYFDESVQGLEPGSPVKYRGVRIGSVEEIAIAPDRKHVEVVLGLLQHDVERLGMADGKPALRTQLAVQGLTGLKFVDIDIVTKLSTPLPFAPAEPYIPSQPSLVSGLTTDMQSLARRLPDLADRTAVTLDKLDLVLDDVHDDHLVDRLVATLATIDTTVAHTGHEADAALARIGRGADHADRVLDQVAVVISDLTELRGLVASARRATDAAGDVARAARTSPEAIDRTLRELAEAARAVRELAEQLDRDPDMLVKGRARSNKR